MFYHLHCQENLICLDAALEAYVSEMHLLFVNSMKISNTFRPANASTTVLFYKFRSTCKIKVSYQSQSLFTLKPIYYPALKFVKA